MDHQTVAADTLARNIEIAGDSRTIIRCLLIVSVSERQQIAALATQEFISRADIWRTAAKQYVEARETRRCPTPMKARPRVGPYPTYG